MDDYEKILQLWKQKQKENIPIEIMLDGKIIPLAYHSGKIENDNIDYNDTREIFEHDCISNYTGNLRTIFEIRNSKDAIEYMLESYTKHKPITLFLIQRFQYELTKNTYDKNRWNSGERPGEFKKHDYVTGIDEVGALPSDVPEELNELIDEINEYRGESILRAGSYFHCKFENIHPFADGNGRTGRLVLNYYLLLNEHPPVIIHEENRKQYFQALEKWDREQKIYSMENFLKRETVNTWEKTLSKNFFH